MRFVHPEIGVVILIILALLWLVSKRRVATVGHSELGIHKKLLMPIAGRIPTIIFSAMWLMIVIAAGQPELITAGEKQPVLARNIVIAVDNSGSMGDLIVENGDGGTTGGDRVLKSDAARAGVKYFIEQRPDDRIALLTFDDQVYYDWPLTTDHDYLLGMLGAIKANISGGTNFDGPTGPYSKVGAIEGAIIHLRETETLAGKIVIIVTDGQDSISEERRIQLENELVEQNISLYVLGVGWEDSETTDLATLVHDIGGKVLLVSDAQSMLEGFLEIDKIEKVTTFITVRETHHDFYQWFVYAAILLFVVYLVSATYARQDT